MHAFAFFGGQHLGGERIQQAGREQRNAAESQEIASREIIREAYQIRRATHANFSLRARCKVV